MEDPLDEFSMKSRADPSKAMHLAEDTSQTTANSPYGGETYEKGLARIDITAQIQG